MSISKTAHKNHEELWPDYQSRAKETDPELIEVFDNFAFDEVISHDQMDTKTRVMVTLCFLIAMGGTESQIKGHILGNVNVGNNRQMLINLMTQLLPYVGYPRSLNAISCLNEVIPA